MDLWIVIKSKLASYIYRHCVVALYRCIHFRDQITSGQFVSLPHVRVQVLAKGTENGNKQEQDWENSTRYRRTILKPKRGVLRKITGDGNTILWGHPSHSRVRRVTGWLVPSLRIWIARRGRNSRSVIRGRVGWKEGEKNEWTDDMSGLQGEDSFFISFSFQLF